MRITSLDDINSWVQTWMKEKWVHKIIAFSGSSSTENPPWIPDELAIQLAQINQAYVDAIITGTLNKLRDYRIAILTGWTKGGVPESTTRVARGLWLPTIWVYPESRANKDSLAQEWLLDCSIEVGSVFGKSMFGDESTVFAKLADASIIFWGNAGTLVEVSHALKLNESLLEIDKITWKVVEKNAWEHRKYIIPVDGVPWIWSVVKLLPWKSYVREWTFPDKNIRSAQDIYMFLKDRLSLADIHIDNDKK